MTIVGQHDSVFMKFSDGLLFRISEDGKKVPVKPEPDMVIAGVVSDNDFAKEFEGDVIHIIPFNEHKLTLKEYRHMINHMNNFLTPPSHYPEFKGLPLSMRHIIKICNNMD